jgi:galactose-1-phosphate uridylyltransferase
MNTTTICKTCKRPITSDESTVTKADGTTHHPKCYMQASNEKSYPKKREGKR